MCCANRISLHDSREPSGSGCRNGSVKQTSDEQAGPYRQIGPSAPSRIPVWAALFVLFGLLLLPGVRSYWPLAILLAGVGVWFGRVSPRAAIAISLIALAAVFARASNFEPWRGVPADGWRGVLPFLATDAVNNSSQTLNFSGVRTLRVRGLNAAVHVKVSDGEHVLQIFRRGSVKVAVARNGDTLSVEARGQPFAFNASAGYDLIVPPDLNLDLTTSNGRLDLDATGRARRVSARSSNGRLTIVNSGAAPLNVETSNASIELVNVGGQVSAGSSNGSIILNGASQAELSLHSSNGGINLTNVSLKAGSNSTVNTSNARIVIEALSAPAGLQVDASTSNAPVRMTLPGGNVTLDQHSGSADLPGAQPARLTLNSSNGEITLR